MRRMLPLLTLAPLLSACEIDLTGLDLSGIGWWGSGLPDYYVSGLVLVDDYSAEEREATVYFYEPTDTLSPVDSAWTSWDGRYVRSWWGEDPTPGVCDWVGRAVLWTGQATELQPIFDASQPCDSTMTYRTGPVFELAYEPLEAPFRLEGTVFLDDNPLQLEVAVPLRGSGGAVLTTTSDADGLYRFETDDPAQRFSWCRWLSAQVTDPISGDPTMATLQEVADPAACGDRRRFPDFRFGATKAVTGTVGIADDPLSGPRLAHLGEATVTLLSPTDSTEVAGPAETLDDGSFHIWWSAEVSQGRFPGCDWLLGVDLEDGRSVIVPMLANPQDQCQADVYRYVEVQ